ncbi:MAG TPA: ABC transporter substrate-binding protein [Acidimicrobiales bacterium]|nr:ABC transporter substrate-binding protein [Acidimicrobiales bacterium]
MSRTYTRRLLTTSSAMLLCTALVMAGGAVVNAGAATHTPGVTAKQITIGATVPLTGIAAAGYNEVAKAADAVFMYVNSKGGVNHRKIKYILKDDCYGTPGFGCTGTPSTVTQTHALLSAPVFATVGSLGTPTQDSVRSLLKSNGVPQLFVNSGSRDWNNPATYPGLFGWQTSYNEESKIFAKYINATYAGANVCFLGQGDDFGSDGLAGLVAGGVTPSDTQLYSVGALVVTQGASLAPYIARFQTDKCTVVVLDTIPGATDAALGAALQLGFSPHWVISSVGSDPATVFAPLAAKGLTTDPEVGAVSFSFLPTAGSSSAWIPWMRKVLTADTSQFPGFSSTTTLDGNMEYGIGWGVAFVEALRATGKNITRASFLKILTSTTFSQTPSLTPLRYTTADHQGLNGGYLVTVTSATSAKPIDGKIYTTDSTSTGPVVSASRLSSGIPSWLK